MVILVILVRITPAKWDSEYSWLRNESLKDRSGTFSTRSASSKIEISRSKDATRNDDRSSFTSEGSEHRKTTVFGLVLQIFGMVALLNVLRLDLDAFALISFGMLLTGEIIFIISLSHRGYGFGER